MKGKDGVPAILTPGDKSLAAFGTGIISSLGVVPFGLSSAPSSIPGSEYRFRKVKMIVSTKVQSMQLSRYSNNGVLEV